MSRYPQSLAHLGIAVSPQGYVQMGDGGEARFPDPLELANDARGLPTFRTEAAKNNRGKTGKRAAGHRCRGGGKWGL